MKLIKNNDEYILKNKYSTIIMSVEPKIPLFNNLLIKFILTKTKNQRKGYGLMIINDAILFAKEKGFDGIIVIENESLSQHVKNILNQLKLDGFIKKDLMYYLFNNIIKK